MKRLFDILFSFIVLLILCPLFVAIILIVITDSKGGAFFGQVRVGLNETQFKLWKFRTMRPNSEARGQITVGARDNRITRVGYYLRKYKLDELPQFWNVLIGDMSVVGPRPEVPKYVEMYSKEQKRVLSLRPGITDFASLEFFTENELLADASNPEKVYTEEIMPKKLELNLRYIDNRTLVTDFLIIYKTIVRVLR